MSQLNSTDNSLQSRKDRMEGITSHTIMFAPPSGPPTPGEPATPGESSKHSAKSLKSAKSFRSFKSFNRGSGDLRPPVSMHNKSKVSSKASLSNSDTSRDSNSMVRRLNGSFLPHPDTLLPQPSWPSFNFLHSNESFSSSIVQEEAKLRWDSEVELKRVSRALLRLQKWGLISGLLMLNAALIFVGWNYWQVYYLFIILLSSNTMLQGAMILCIIAHFLGTSLVRAFRKMKNKVKNHGDHDNGNDNGNSTGVENGGEDGVENVDDFGLALSDVEVQALPPLEKLVLLLPCYNETHEELVRSLDSLIDQKGIECHPRAIFIVVDGNVRGPGMDKTTQDYLLEDILDAGHRKTFENGYRARDGLFMPVVVQTGFYRSLPYIFVGKRYNQGKRDSLCFARSFLYHYKNRSENLVTMFNHDLFEHIGTAFLQLGIDTIDYLVGMDADTVFEQTCVYEMLQVIRKNPKLVGVCGHVCVDFDGKDWGLWSLYQSVEYSQTQGLRRMFQSRITGKVNCLPGCCQLIRVDESTFGDAVLRERFGYCPKPNDVMTQHIMGNYSEDSIHASIIFSLFPKKQTAQALRAKAFTIVPQNWKVFLSQRKRWALGSISNEFVMIFRPGIIAIERLQSIIAVITWAITPFIIAAFAELIIIFARRGKELFADPVFLGLIAVLWFRYTYSFCIGFWLPRNRKERLQYFVGFFLHFFTSPFMNIIILVYSLFHSDDFKWGKTREVIRGDDEKEGDDTGGRGTH